MFDTYKSGTVFDDFVGKGLPYGQVVVAACKDDCVTNMSDLGKKFFSAMGSKEIFNLQYRQGWSFIGITGRKESNEKRATKLVPQVSCTSVFEVHTMSELKR